MSSLTADISIAGAAGMCGKYHLHTEVAELHIINPHLIQQRLLVTCSSIFIQKCSMKTRTEHKVG